MNHESNSIKNNNKKISRTSTNQMQYCNVVGICANKDCGKIELTWLECKVIDIKPTLSSQAAAEPDQQVVNDLLRQGYL